MSDDGAATPTDETNDGSQSGDSGDVEFTERAEVEGERRERPSATSGRDDSHGRDVPDGRSARPRWTPATAGVFLCVLVAALLAPTVADAVGRGRLFYAGLVLVIGGLLYSGVGEWLFRTTVSAESAGGPDTARESGPGAGDAAASAPDSERVDSPSAFAADALSVGGVVLVVVGLAWMALETYPNFVWWL